MKETAYPLLFTFREPVAGKGFLAGVSARGRVLAVFEDGEWWYYGVEPGAMAEGGATPQEAYARFLAALRNYLQDAAAEATSFQDLEAEVRRFFRQIDDVEETRWKAVLRAVRNGDVAAEGPFSELPREPADSPCGLLGFVRLDEASGFEAVKRSSVPPELFRPAA